jgi:hypothetical protein
MPARTTPNLLVFFKEDELQNHVAKTPSLITGSDQPAAVAREVGVPHRVGRADLVAVNAKGEITIVECKLAANPESHGSVIGQGLSYAAGLSGLAYHEFKERFEARGVSLTKPFEGDPSWDLATFSKAVAHNLKTGIFRLVIAVDEMSPALRQTLAFLKDRPLRGIQIASVEISPAPSEGAWPKDARQMLIAKVHARSGTSAAQTAEALLVWADRERLMVECDGKTAVVEADHGTLFRIHRGQYVRVSVDRIRQALGDEAGKQLEQDLERISVPTKGRKARARLESLDTREFLGRMKQLLDDLAAAAE